MALSMFEKERSARTDASTKTWRALVVGAAVPIAMLAAAPAVSAAETGDQAETVNSEQLPVPDPGLPDPGLPDPGLPVPGGLDPAALAQLPDLLTCVSDLLDGLAADVPAPAPAPPVEGSEQVPPLPLPDPGVPAPGGDAPLPDIADLTTKCQDALANLPAGPGDVPPVEPPVGAPPVAPPVE
jgi:hypothetical protein